MAYFDTSSFVGVSLNDIFASEDVCAQLSTTTEAESETTEVDTEVTEVPGEAIKVPSGATKVAVFETDGKTECE